MKKDKRGTIGWIFTILETMIGLVLFLSARLEIASASWYSWTPPYTEYEAKILTINWIGLILLISGLLSVCVRIFKIAYTKKHVQDINSITQKNGTLTCAHCGLNVTADVQTCPRCGKPIEK